MFTGIVQGVGRIRSVEPRGGDVAMWIDTGEVPLAGVEVGGSIAVNGCCLTAIEFDGNAFKADLSRETLALTTAGTWAPGTRVNLERALTAGQALGGHYVTGHVDGVGEVVSRHEDARSIRMEFEVPVDLARYIARKGSVCVDGVSLTVNAADDRGFEVNLVPHTIANTAFADTPLAAWVNLEVDLIARYVERLTGSP